MAVVFDPNSVTGLKVDSDASEKNAVLTWDAFSFDESPLAKYEIYVDGKFYKASKKNTLSVKKLSPGEHSYSVVAVAKNGDKTTESIDESFKVADVTAPKMGKIKAVQSDADSITVTWDPATDKGKIAKYVVKCGDQEQVVYAGSDLSCTFDDVVGSSVAVTVTAYDTNIIDPASDGNASKPGKAKVKMVDMIDPDKVDNVRISGEINKKYQGLFTWNKANDNSGKPVKYEIRLDGNDSKYFKSSKTSVKLSKLGVGIHTIQVRAIDKAKNEGEWSDVYTFTVTDKTAPKAGKVALAEIEDRLEISMSGFTDNSGSIAYYKITVNGEVVADKCTTSTYVYEQSGLSGKVNVQVIAYDKDGNYSKAAKKSIKIKAAAPVEPTTPVEPSKPDTPTKKGLNLTLNGVSEKVYDGWEEDFEDTQSDDDYDKIKELSYIKKKFQDKKLFHSAVNGTEFDDVVKVAANNFAAVDGQISLGGGDDQLILSKASTDTHTQLRVYVAGGNDDLGTIDFGAGDDILRIEEEGDLRIKNINFGDGNDQLILKAGADGLRYDDLYYGSNSADTSFIDFGDGNDKMVIEGHFEDQIITNRISFGAGNDVLDIKKLNAWSYIDIIDFGSGDDVVNAGNVDLHNIDFGDGNDTLNMNGTLLVDKLVNLEKVTGKGTLVLKYGHPEDDVPVELFKQAGIDVVYAGSGFVSREQAKQDDTKEGAIDIADTYVGGSDGTFYLESEASAESKGEYGCADTVDWFKFDTGSIKDDDLEICIWAYGVTCTMYDPDGKETVLSDCSGLEFDVDDLKKGTYYFKMEIASGCSIVTGNILLDD